MFLGRSTVQWTALISSLVGGLQVVVPIMAPQLDPGQVATVLGVVTDPPVPVTPSTVMVNVAVAVGAKLRVRAWMSKVHSAPVVTLRANVTVSSVGSDVLPVLSPASV